MNKIAMVCLLMVVSNIADAEPIYAGSLAEDCGFNNQPFTPFCHGYLTGVIDEVELQMRSGNLTITYMCIPEIADVTTAYLQYFSRREDQVYNLPAATVVKEAMKQAYPCRR